MKLLHCLIVSASLLIASTSEAASRYPVVAEKGMVVSAHELASEAGVEMLRRGGNAVDAAVAAAFVAGVVEPYSAGIGGGGFMLVRDPAADEIVVIDYRESAPAAAFRDMYLDEDGNVIEGATLKGHLSVGVPGTVAGLAMAVEQYGELSLAEILEPSIRYAEEGFAAHPAYLEKLGYTTELLNSYPESARIFLTEDGIVEPDELIVQSDLAETLRAIAERGPSAFYTGAIASAIANDMKANDGLITVEDLNNYKPKLRKPIVGTYNGVTIYTMPPPSSGGVHLVQMLNILEGYDIAENGYGAARSIHLMTEAMRRAYADRSEYLGDPDFNDVPVEELTSKDYAAHLRRLIVEVKAAKSEEVRPGLMTFVESPSTTHVSTIDENGWAVSMTQSINYSFGAGVTVPGTGILLNNTMDDFSAKPGVPNVYGLVGSEANAVAANKIPLSSMTPTIVMKDDEPYLIIGSPGGSTIINTVLQVIINVVDHGMDIRMAIDKPKIHHQWLPDELRYEPYGIPSTIREMLEEMGHQVVEKPVFGNAMGIIVDQGTGRFEGAADARGVGKAVGY